MYVFFLDEKDTLGARSKIGYNDIGYLPLIFPQFDGLLKTSLKN